MILDKKNKLKVLSKRVTSCKKCPRLTEYIQRASTYKVPRFKDWNYWGGPLPGFGDPEAKLLIIGLAPAVHGGNRTGRMFTGDSSGDWLIKALYQTGFSNQPESLSKDDGLKLESAYITAVVRCAPPENKPLVEEVRNCSEYLLEEIRILDSVEVILTLGRVAFDTYLRYNCTKDERRSFRFQHAGLFKLEKYSLVSSYHPSRQNTQTGRLTWDMWINIFQKIKMNLIKN